MKSIPWPEIVLIAAMDRGRVIGLPSGGIPWRLPDDVARFRARARGRHLLLGRRTFDEMRGWFTDQTPLVMTRRRDFEVERGRAVESLDQALRIAASAGQKELLVAGGAEIFALALPRAERLILTLVETDIEAGFPKELAAGLPRFPDYRAAGDWREVSQESRPADAGHAFARAFLELERS